jgi:hypothetical protein
VAKTALPGQSLGQLQLSPYPLEAMTQQWADKGAEEKQEKKGRKINTMNENRRRR